MKKLNCFVVLVLVLVSSTVYALDEITLHGGRVVSGEIVEETDEYVRIKSSGIPLTYYKDDISGIERIKMQSGHLRSRTYKKIGFSPEEENTLNIFKDTLEKNFRKTATSYADSCSSFPDKLKQCIPYECEFVHPFSGETMKKKVIGKRNNACRYEEEMPGGGKMECDFPLNDLAEIAKFYKKTAQDMEKGRISGGTSSNNPVQKCMNNGSCKFSGY